MQALLPQTSRTGEAETSILAIDLETNGNDPTHPDFQILGIGFADERACWYMDWRRVDPAVRAWVTARLQSRPVTAFNVGFDGAALKREGFGWLQWTMCTFGLYFQLAAEGFDGQTHDLESLQRDVLGWTGSNKAELGKLLAKHGLKKPEMGRLADLEPYDFGRYCALDAETALQGFYELRDATFRLGDAGVTLRQYHKEDFLNEVELLVEATERGMAVNVPKLKQFRGMTWLTIQEDTLAFLSRPEVRPHVEEYNTAARVKLLSPEPPRTTADGEPSKRWDNWDAKRSSLELANHFNPRSGPQLQWLFFDRLGHVPRKYTNKGAPSVDKEVLPFLGPAGKFLSGIRKRVKLLEYVDACLSRQRDGVLHAPYKTVGTVTGRLGGGDSEDD